MKLKTEIKECKKHGLTDHVTYLLKNNRTHTQCVQCYREYKRKKYASDKDYRKRNKEYTRNWMEKNKNLVNFYKEKFNKKIKNKNQSIKQYYANIYIQNKSEIDSILKIYNIKINNITNLITKNKADNINKILNIIRNKKFQEIKYSKLYEWSSVVKYRWGVRDNFSEQPKQIKNKIRAEYTKLGISKAQKELEKLDKLYKLS